MPRKFLQRECDLLILDEVLGLIERGIISVEELKSILTCREDTGVILTGIRLDDEISVLADKVFKIDTVKSDHSAESGQ